ncbi:MAG: hypothetical protein M3280_04070 [Actinomycetota bacterium]|nr:hypothetical protein [Actinomycetota bacterium]
MKFSQIVAVTALVGLVGGLLATNARAEVSGTSTGGGFVREVPEGSKGKSQATKTMLSLTAFDNTDGDSGNANYVVQQPKSKPSTHLRLTLDCVTVSGNQAFASGVDRNDDRYYLIVEDNGEPGRNNDEFGLAGDSITRSIAFLLGLDCGAIDFGTDPINGGNFRVVEAS